MSSKQIHFVPNHFPLYFRNISTSSNNQWSKLSFALFADEFSSQCSSTGDAKFDAEDNIVQPVAQCKALYHYTPNFTDELELNPGDLLSVYRKQEDGWWLGECNGNVGIFPATYVESVPKWDEWTDVFYILKNKWRWDEWRWFFVLNKLFKNNTDFFFKWRKLISSQAFELQGGSVAS